MRARGHTLSLLQPARLLPPCSRTQTHHQPSDTNQHTRAQVVLGVDMFCLLAYNMSGMLVTDHLGAVFRTVLETMRTLFVWLLGLLLFYTPLGMGFLGESWSAWSFLQAAG